MKIRCSKKDLNAAVFSTQKAVSNKSILSVMDGLLLTVENNKIILRGNDMEMGIEYTIPGIIEEEGSVIVNSKYFSDIIRKFPDEEITISCNSEYKVNILCDNSVIDLNGMSPDGFPEIPTVNNENEISLKQDILKDMIKKIIFSVSLDEKMPVLTGCLLETGENFIYLVSIDGYRMSYRKEYILGVKKGISVIIPGKALSEISKLLKDDDSDVTIYYEKNQILFNFGNCKLITKLLQGDYINYKSIYPDTFITEVIVETKKLLSSVERANLIIIEDVKTPVKFIIEENIINIFSITDIGKVEEKVNIEKEGEDLTISFNPKYLIDVLKNIEDEKFKISFSGEIGACVLSPINNDEFSYVILPVRTN